MIQIHDITFFGGTLDRWVRIRLAPNRLTTTVEVLDVRGERVWFGSLGSSTTLADTRTLARQVAHQLHGAPLLANDPEFRWIHQTLIKAHPPDPREVVRDAGKP